MNSTTTWTTAITPSCFGMPASGHALLAATIADARPATVLKRERVTLQGAVAGRIAFAQTYVPGTRAWRPPSC